MGVPRATMILSSVYAYLTQLLSHREYARNANVIQPRVVRGSRLGKFRAHGVSCTPLCTVRFAQ